MLCSFPYVVEWRAALSPAFGKPPDAGLQQPSHLLPAVEAEDPLEQGHRVGFKTVSSSMFKVLLLLLLLLLEGDRHTSTASGGLAYEWMALS